MGHAASRDDGCILHPRHPRLSDDIVKVAGRLWIIFEQDRLSFRAKVEAYSQRCVLMGWWMIRKKRRERSTPNNIFGHVIWYITIVVYIIDSLTKTSSWSDVATWLEQSKWTMSNDRADGSIIAAGYSILEAAPATVKLYTPWAGWGQWLRRPFSFSVLFTKMSGYSKPKSYSTGKINLLLEALLSVNYC